MQHESKLRRKINDKDISSTLINICLPFSDLRAGLRVRLVAVLLRARGDRGEHAHQLLRQGLHGLPEASPHGAPLHQGVREPVRGGRRLGG